MERQIGKPARSTLLKLGIAIFLLYLAIHYWDAFINILVKVYHAAGPLLWGLILAYLINILMTFYERHYFNKQAQKPIVQKSRRPVCLLLALFTLLGIVAVIISLVLPELIAAVHLLITKAQQAIDNLTQNTALMGFLPEEIIAFLNAVDWESRLSQIITFVTESLGATVSLAADTVFSVASSMVTFVIAVIFSLYVLFSKEKLQHQCQRLMKQYLKPAWNDNVSHVMHVANDSFHRYIVGQCLEAAILGGLCTAGMLLLKLPYAPMIGALIGVTALIPVAGAYIGAIVGAFLILTISPVKALIFIIFLVLLQQFEGNVIYPKVVGSSIGLPAIWVLAAITVGGGLSGIVGMLGGVPITSIAYRLLHEDLLKRERHAVSPSEEEATS